MSASRTAKGVIRHVAHLASRMGRGVFPGLVAAAAMVGACGGEADSESAAPAPLASVDLNLWQTAWDISNAEQREALSDGELTFAEYEAAALRTVECLDAAGIQGEATLERNSQTYALGARWHASGPDDPTSAEKQSAAARCYADHWEGISQAWTAHSTPTESEIESARQALAQCMREGGLEVPEPASSQDLIRHQGHEVYAACAQRIAEEYGLPNFGG